MTYRVTIHTAAPLGHHGRAKIETFVSRSEAEQYARDARREDSTADVHVTGQHEDPPVSVERAREWMAYLNGVLQNSPAIADHKHANGWQHCPICGRNAVPPVRTTHNPHRGTLTT